MMQSDQIRDTIEIPARATVCFVWSAVHADFIAVGCAEDGWRGRCDARETMIVSGSVVGKRFRDLRKDRALQLRESPAKAFRVDSLADYSDAIEGALQEIRTAQESKR